MAKDRENGSDRVMAVAEVATDFRLVRIATRSETRMLDDPSDPMVKKIFRAAALMDGVMKRGQRMSVSPSTVRAELLAECLPMFAEMRELARPWFTEQAPFIVEAVDEYERAIRELAALGEGRIEEDRRDGTGSCPVCGTAITHYAKYRIVCCSRCGEPFMKAYSKLDSSEGFATWAI